MPPPRPEPAKAGAVPATLRNLEPTMDTPALHDLSVGDVARRSGVSASALRFYEREGLIGSIRTASNQRRYRRDVLRRLGVIKAAQHLGIPLASIREAFSLLPQGRPPSEADWERLARRWQRELDDRIARIQLLRERLTGCIGCGCLSMKLCPLVNAGDKAAARGVGAILLEPQNA
jgi:MerR family redox-sensitive transcriptional activator SoxR